MSRSNLPFFKTVDSIECAFDTLQEKVLESTSANAVTFSAEEAARLKESAVYLNNQSYSRAVTVQVISCILILAAFLLSGTFAGVVVTVLIVMSLGIQERLFDWYYAKAANIGDVLAPLKGRAQCAEALKLAKECPLCQAYRQAVIRENREFRVLDLVFMEKLEVKAKKSACEEKDRAICQELHGLST